MTTKAQIDMKEVTAKLLEMNNAPPGRDYTRDRHEALKDFTLENLINDCYEIQEKKKNMEEN